MSKNIRFDLAVENKLREDFFSKYMPLNKPINEIIDMFLEDEDYNAIAKNEEEMREKLQSWVELYKEIDERKEIPNYKELKNRMKKLLREYAFNQNDAKGIFIGRMMEKGMNEEEAEEIANLILKEIEEEKQL